MKKILVIDDSSVVLDLTKKTLEACGFTVDARSDLGEFDPAAPGAPDLVLVDINMSEFYGDDIVPFLRAEGSVTAPIYLFSNIAEQELATRAAECGADGYISKQWGVRRLLEIVKSVLGS